MACAQEGGTSYERELKSIRAQEKQRMSSACIRRTYRKGCNGGVMAVVAKKQDGEWRETMDQRAME